MLLPRALAAAAIGALAAIGAASAAELSGTDGPDRLLGTPAADTMYGLRGNDRLEGRGGPDLLHGGPGRDVILGAAGNDRIAVHTDRARDTVSCGRGFDTVDAELADVVAVDCEIVARQLSRDVLRLVDAQSESQVEPDSFAFGSTVVTAFQSGRLLEGGAAGIGWSTSRDGGKTWRSGFLERTTERASDPTVAYDVAHRTWLIATLGASSGSAALLVSRSRDGLAWSRSTPAADDHDEHYDKEWIACDTWPRSPYRGRCYLSYRDGTSSEIRTRRSTDGGMSWSPPVGVRAPGTAIPNGAFPVVRPDGSLVLLFTVTPTMPTDVDAVVAARSIDGGVSFGTTTVVAEQFEEQVFGVRAPAFVSADVDGAGRVYAVWSDCRFQPECGANTVVVVTSRDGITWTEPRPVPLAAPGEVDWVVPALAVQPGTSGARARVTVEAYAVMRAYGCQECGTVDAFALQSVDGGRTWDVTRRISTEPMDVTWLADTSLGRMLADYISVSYVAGKPVAVLSLADRPVDGVYRQAIFAAVLPVPATAR
jgi:hemolysin type calcium-binding protein/BNR repeat protein